MDHFPETSTSHVKRQLNAAAYQLAKNGGGVLSFTTTPPLSVSRPKSRWSFRLLRRRPGILQRPSAAAVFMAERVSSSPGSAQHNRNETPPRRNPISELSNLWNNLNLSRKAFPTLSHNNTLLGTPHIGIQRRDSTRKSWDLIAGRIPRGSVSKSRQAGADTAHHRNQITGKDS
ncbi:hypothetical protein M569_16707 [Genlisea aurea]|uniref:Uncharacterized protein n=1 Tax=Genlisea aurea TaxID=192259 RepID=S8BUQ7_9LAMI|nr:hypothetical protein M569_16707 [Genlisea aurea]